MSNNYAVEVTRLTKRLRHEDILKDIDMQVPYGEIVGIMGTNGSGKTLLLRLLCGLAYPTSGQIRINGQLLRRSHFPTRVGVIIESPGFLPHLTGFENLMLLAQINGRADQRAIERAIDSLGLSAVAHKRVRTYSLGMRQRLGLAQAIMEQPNVLLLDEPTNGLDPDGVDHVMELFAEFRRRNVAIVWVSHETERLTQVSDRIMKLQNGKLLLQATEVTSIHVED